MNLDKDDIMFYIFIALAMILVLIICAPVDKGVGIVMNKGLDIASEVIDELN